jgi:hypothetical protein
VIAAAAAWARVAVLALAAAVQPDQWRHQCDVVQ